MSKHIGTLACGLKMPFLTDQFTGGQAGLINMIVDELKAINGDPECSIKIDDGDILGVTESFLARAQGNYVTLKEVGEQVDTLFGKTEYYDLALVQPIASRNRFLPILRGIAMAPLVRNITVYMSPCDEQGNMVHSHQVTKVNYIKLYESVPKVQVKLVSEDLVVQVVKNDEQENLLICKVHNYENLRKELQKNCPNRIYSLINLCGYNNEDAVTWSEYGLYGSNMAGNGKLKLFPRDSIKFCYQLQGIIKKVMGMKLEVFVFGDGAYKDPKTKIWELADPVVTPGYTEGLCGEPCEIKLKNELDSGKSPEEVKTMIEDPSKTQGLGTTPRRIRDLVGSLSDLITGSGDKGTPVVLIKNYFNNYCSM